MGRHLDFLLRRILSTLVTLLLLVTFSFFLFRTFPGNPFSEESNLSPEVLQILNQSYGLNQPLLIQWSYFLKELIFHGGGSSFQNPDRTVLDLLTPSFLVTLKLSLLAFFGTLILTVLWTQLFKEQSRLKPLKLPFISLFLSAPTLLLAPLLILLFGLSLDWLPVARLDHWTGYILPIAVMSLRPSVMLFRLFDSASEEQMRSQVTRTHRGFGFSENKILWKWNLKSSLIPCLHFIFPFLVGLLGGSVVVEMIFGIQGLGFQFLQALSYRDYPTLLFMTLGMGLFLQISSLLIDFSLARLDPRISLEGRGQ
ncbi:MAG: ABC transporter permease [Pseudobdellovibrionaceae bacterium]